MPDPKPDNVDDLLNLDGLDEPAVPAPGEGEPGSPEDPEGAKGKKPDQKPADDVSKRINSLEENNKNLAETVRQLSEQNKTLSEFHDRVTGADTDKAEKEKEQELHKKYEENPVDTTRQIIRQELSEIKDGLNLVNQTNVVDRAMRKIDEKYVIDWDKDYKKIKAELANFSPDAKKGDPEGSLLRAAKLAGVAKSRQEPGSPPGFPQGRRGGNPPNRKGEEPEDDINERLNKIGKKKKDNVFNL